MEWRLPIADRPASERDRRLGLGLWGLGLCLFCVLIWRSSGLGLGVLLKALRGVKATVQFAPLDRVLFEVSFAGLNALWLFWLLRDLARPLSFRSALLLSAPFLLVAAVAIPESSDPFLYLHYGHGANQGLNVWRTPSGAFGSTFSTMIRWHQPSTYPPAALGLFRLSAWGLEVNAWCALAIWKALCLAAHVGAAYALSAAARLAYGPGLAPTIGLAYLLQPLVLVQVAAEGHLDGLVNLVSALLVLCLFRERSWLLLPLAGLGVACKVFPLIWIPGLALYLYQRRDFRALALALTVAVLALSGLTLALAPAEWTVFLNRTTHETHARSFTAIVLMLQRLLGVDAPMRAFMVLGKLAFVGVWLVSLLPLARRRLPSRDLLLEHLLWSTLALFLLGTTWVVSWYAVTLVPLVFFVRSPGLVAASLAYVVGASCSFGLDLSPSDAASLVIACVTTLPAAAIGVWHVRERRARGVTSRAANGE